MGTNDHIERPKLQLGILQRLEILKADVRDHNQQF